MPRMAGRCLSAALGFFHRRRSPCRGYGSLRRPKAARRSSRAGRAGPLRKGAGGRSMTLALDPRAIAHALGGSVVNRNSVAAPGPGHSRADRSLSIKLVPGAPDGFVVYSHAGDDPIHCRDYVRERLGLPSWRPCRPNEKRSPAPARRSAPARDEGKSENRAIALWIWQESQNPRGTIAEAYLKSRALQLTDDIAGDVVRFHPRVWHKTSQMPLAAMVALFRDIRSSEPKAIH